MRLNSLMHDILLRLAAGSAPQIDVLCELERRRPRRILTDQFFASLHQLANAGLLVYRPRRLSDRQLTLMLKSLARNSDRIEPLRKYDYIWLTRDGYALADLIAMSELVPPGRAGRARVIIRRAIKRVVVKPRASAASQPRGR